MSQKSYTTVGYHGTSELNALRIVDEGFKLSTGSGQWLGTGVYFFERGPEHAAAWARKRAELFGGRPAVIEVQLNTQSFLYLGDRVHWPAMSKLANELIRNGAPSQIGLQKNFDEIVRQKDGWGKNFLDHVVVENFISLMNSKYPDSIGGVVSPFVSGAQVYTDSFFCTRSCNMISVLHPRLINFLGISVL